VSDQIWRQAQITAFRISHAHGIECYFEIGISKFIKPTNKTKHLPNRRKKFILANRYTKHGDPIMKTKSILVIYAMVILITFLSGASGFAGAQSPTRTPSPTPRLTQTEIARRATGTTIARNTARTGTAEAVKIIRTGTAEAIRVIRTGTAEAVREIRTGTAEAIKINRTETAEARGATATFVAEYKPMNFRELVNYADRHVGEKVLVRGRIFNIIDGETFQLYFEGTREAAVISSLTPISFYENDFVTVYAIVAGFFKGTNAFGGTIKQPLLVGVSIIGPKR